ncbi:MAG: F0F1 ATP synthase subunit B [Pirellulales bacterium]
MRYHPIFLLLFVVCWGACWAVAQQAAALEDTPTTSEDSKANHSDEGHSTETHTHGDESEGAHGAEDAHGSDPNPLAVDPDLAIWTVVVFGVLLFVLNKFAWPAISSALDERESRIEGNIAAAASKHEEAKQLLAEHEAKLAEASGQVRELLEEARRDAEHTKAQILEEAKQAATAERERVIREVDRAAEAAVQQLAETSANLAVDLASKVVQTNVTQDQQTQLVRDALAMLAQSGPSDN